MYKQFKQRGINQSTLRPRPEQDGLTKKFDYKNINKKSKEKIMEGITPICPYCGKFSKKVSGKEVYPHRKDLHKITIYRCLPCNAYVGCHGTSDRPLGRLANDELRRSKNSAHRAFDPLWRNGGMKRPEAYKWLGKALGIEGKDCHIGMFDVEMCKAVVRHSLHKALELLPL